MEKNYLNTRSRRANCPGVLKSLLTTLSFCSVFLIAQTGYSQISYNYDWEPTGLGGWVSGGSSGSFLRNTASPCTGTASIRANIYFGASSTFTSPALTGTNGGDITLQFNYKIVEYSNVGTGTPLADIGTIKIEHATAAGGPWSTFSTISSANHVVSGTCATKTVVKTGVPATGDNFFRFVAQATSGGDTYVYFDDVIITQGPTPTCLSPIALTTTSLTQNSATLAWTESGTATDWDVEYGVVGFTPTGTPNVALTTNPTPISGLTPFTGYEFYVRSVCSGSDMSTWSGPYYFYTGYCEVSTASSFDYTSAFSTSGAVDNVSYSAGSQAPGSYSNETAQVFTSFPTQQIQFSHTYVGGNNSYKIWVDWNNDLDFDDLGEEMNSFLAVSSPHTGSFSVPTGTPVGAYTVRVRSVYDYSGTENVTPCGQLSYGSTIDFLLNVTAAPSCLPPSMLAITGETSTSAIFGWTENGTATDWDIEYGVTGFTPTGVPTASVSSNPTTLTGLLSNTDYDVYVRSSCSGSDKSTWSGPISFLTLCDAFNPIDVCEDFEDNSTTLNCWRVIDGNNDGNTWGRFLGYPNNGLVSAGIYTDGNSGANDDYLVTPNLILTGNEVMKFAYRVRSAGEPNDFQVLLSTTGVSAADFTDTLMHLASYSNIDYKDTVLDLSAYTGNVYIAFHVPAGGLDGWYLFIDDVCFDICTPAPGVSASQTVCSLDQTLDLNTVITQGETNGVWSFDTNPSALNGSDLNLTALPYGTSSFNYIVTTGCTSDTTVATITVVQPSSAGSDGSIAVCRNQPFNLLSGLVGSANLGGVWTDPNAVVVPSGNATASNIPGQYNFKYIVSNGVCPSDTAKVVVNVQGCDYLGLEDVAFDGFNLYPNPTTDLIYITNAGSSEVFSYEVLDMNGRVILKANNAINGTATTEINLNKVEVGVYMVRVFNDNANKTFRVVKN